MLWNNHCEKCGKSFLSGDKPPKECPHCRRFKEEEEEKRVSASANAVAQGRFCPEKNSDE